MKFNLYTRPKPRKWDGRDLGPHRVEIKYDGHRVTLLKDDEGRVRAVKRQLHVDVWEQIRRWEVLERAAQRLPEGSVVDGELYVLGRPASDVATACAEGPERWPELSFSAFAVPVLSHVPVLHSWARHDEFMASIGTMGFGVAWRVASAASIEELQARACGEGVEGYVLKQQPYSSWWKVKPLDTVDCVVISTKYGKGKHSGRTGALVVGLYDGIDLVEVASVGKGRDEEWRGLAYADTVGRVCEVSFEGLASQGRLKFSSFVRWRDDKPARECTFDQLS